MPQKTIQEIADHVNGSIVGDSTLAIESASTLDSAGAGQITFLSNPKYAPRVKETRAAAIMVAQEVETNAVQIITLPWVQALYSGYQASEIVPDGAYRLRTDRPVTVYQYNPLEYNTGSGFTYTNDASLLLPVTAWTGNYRVMASIKK